MIVVLASLRLAALARWNKAWAVAVSCRVGRQVTTRCPGLVDQALVAAGAPQPSGVPARRGPRHRVGLPSLTPERVGRFRLLLGRSEDHRGDFPLHSAPSRLVERPGDRTLCVVWGNRQRQRPCSHGSHGHHDENDEPPQFVSAPSWWTGRRRSAPAKVGNQRTTPRRSGKVRSVGARVGVTDRPDPRAPLAAYPPAALESPHSSEEAAASPPTWRPSRDLWRCRGRAGPPRRPWLRQRAIRRGQAAGRSRRRAVAANSWTSASDSTRSWPRASRSRPAGMMATP